MEAQPVQYLMKERRFIYMFAVDRGFSRIDRYDTYRNVWEEVVPMAPTVPPPVEAEAYPREEPNPAIVDTERFRLLPGPGQP